MNNNKPPIQGDLTTFKEIYDRFLGKITDDMYMELTLQDTMKDLKNILMDAIPGFEFPRFPLYDYDEDLEEFGTHLTSEEINIFALLMYNVWLQRQIASIEQTRMKYSGSKIWPSLLEIVIKILGKTGKLRLLTRAEVQI